LVILHDQRHDVSQRAGIHEDQIAFKFFLRSRT
jgi:hypothetical protein